MRSQLASLALLLGCLMSAPSFADIPRQDLPVVKSLTNQLELTAREVQRHADRQTPYLNRDEQWMLRSLDRFRGSAARFDRLLETYFANRAEAEAELRDLNASAEQIRGTVYRSPAMVPVLREWEQAERTLAEINRYAYAEPRYVYPPPR